MAGHDWLFVAPERSAPDALLLPPSSTGPPVARATGCAVTGCADAQALYLRRHGGPPGRIGTRRCGARRCAPPLPALRGPSILWLESLLRPATVAVLGQRADATFQYFHGDRPRDFRSIPRRPALASGPSPSSEACAQNTSVLSPPSLRQSPRCSRRERCRATRSRPAQCLLRRAVFLPSVTMMLSARAVPSCELEARRAVSIRAELKQRSWLRRPSIHQSPRCSRRAVPSRAARGATRRRPSVLPSFRPSVLPSESVCTSLVLPSVRGARCSGRDTMVLVHRGSH